MTKLQNIDALKAAGEVVTGTAELVEQIAKRFDRQPALFFKPLAGALELLTWRSIQNLPVAGTVMEPIEQIVADHGHPTDGTAGPIIDALRIDRKHLHAFACSCHSAIPGSMVAIGLRNFAATL